MFSNQVILAEEPASSSVGVQPSQITLSCDLLPAYGTLHLPLAHTCQALPMEHVAARQPPHVVLQLIAADGTPLATAIFLCVAFQLQLCFCAICICNRRAFRKPSWVEIWAQ